jgi:hypothetical protein
MKRNRQCLAASAGTVLSFFRNIVGISGEVVNAFRTDFTVKSERVFVELEGAQSQDERLAKCAVSR